MIKSAFKYFTICILIVLFALPMPAFAKNTADGYCDDKNYGFIVPETWGYSYGTLSDYALSNGESGQDLAEISEFPKSSKSAKSYFYKASSLPTQFDIREGNEELGIAPIELPAVRNQNPYGTCWAHATCACMEINLIKKELATKTIDLSELQLAYYAHYSALDPLGLTKGDSYSYDYDTLCFACVGGNSQMSLGVLADGMGLSDENEVQKLKYSEIQNCIHKDVPLDDDELHNINLLEENLAYSNTYAKMIGYKEIDNNADSATEIKKAIMQYGAVMASYYHDNLYLKDASYYYGYTHEANHAITVIGWDDNYNASNFKSKPLRNGAWICRNSWGTNMFDDGYFYISYADGSFGCAACFEAALADESDNIYFYDHFNGLSDFNANYDAANVFTACGCKEGSEDIYAISMIMDGHKGDQARFRVYKYLTDPNIPDSCTDFEEFTVTLSSNGYQYIYIDLQKDCNISPIHLQEGDVFSIMMMHSERLSVKACCEINSLPGESFYRAEQNGKLTEWEQADNFNFCFKVFTKDNANSDNPEDYVAAESISVECDKLSLLTKESRVITAKVLPENATYKDVVWTSSDPDVVEVIGYNRIRTGEKAGTATLTVTHQKDKTLVKTVEIVVFPRVESIKTEGPSSGEVGQQLIYTISWSPKVDGYTPNFNCKISDETIAKIDKVEDGKIYVTAIRPGSVYLSTTTDYAVSMNLGKSINVFQKYNVSYSLDGGINSEYNESFVYDSYPYLFTYKPVKSGYDFVGWYLDPNFEEAYVDGIVITGDITLYAKWIKKPDGGNGGSGDDGPNGNDDGGNGGNEPGSGDGGNGGSSDDGPSGNDDGGNGGSGDDGPSGNGDGGNGGSGDDGPSGNVDGGNGGSGDDGPSGNVDGGNGGTGNAGPGSVKGGNSDNIGDGTAQSGSESSPSENEVDRTSVKTKTYKNLKYVITDKQLRYVELVGSKITAGKVTVPDTIKLSGKTYKVTSIGKEAFAGSKISSIVIGKYVTKIGEAAFQNCKVSSVNLGTKVVSIGKYAFKNCTKLTKISIGTNVSEIGKSAFYGCKKLNSVTLNSKKLASVGKDAFSKVGSKCKISIKASYYKKYKALIKKSGYKGKYTKK